MKKIYLGAGIALLLPALLTGCLDNNYDLSDIDTDSQIAINNLTIPINLDPVRLGDFFEPEGDIKEIEINGKTIYALVQGGTFESDPIEIPAVDISTPALAHTEETLTQIPSSLPSMRRAISAEQLEALAPTYNILPMGSDIKYTAPSIDNSILAVESAIVHQQGSTNSPVEFSITLSTVGLAQVVDKMVFTDLVILCPKGLSFNGSAANVTGGVGSYDPTTGKWTIPSLEWPGTGGTISLKTDRIGFANSQINTAVNPHTFSFDTQLKVNGGTLKLIPTLENGIPSSLPASISFRADYNLTNQITVAGVSATIQYDIDGFDIDPIDLSDLPDFLDNDETSLVLGNPQIYIGLNNPLAGVRPDGMKPEVDMSFTAVRHNGTPDFDFPLGQPIVLGTDKGVTGPYNFVLAPQNATLCFPSDYDRQYPGAQKINFNGLSRILSNTNEQGVQYPDAGLPDQIKITVSNPHVPATRVTDFMLGQAGKLQAVSGSYDIVAPLSLGQGTKILYSGSEDDWDNEDIEDLEIYTLKVTADALSTLPVNASLTVKLKTKDVYGNIIDLPCRTSTAELNAGKQGKIEIGVEALRDDLPIKNIAGWEYYAVLEAPDSPEALSPDQTITLSKIRATISGKYNIKKD